LSQSGGEKPLLLGSVKTESRFSSVNWSPATLGGKYPMGLLAGGMETGVIYVWNPEALIANKPSIVFSFKQHASGPVKALKFNPLVPTQLATGGSDGKVLIIDLDQPGSVYMPCANGSQQNAQITALAWNTQVSHIVASAAADGTVAVWDLKSKKVWCELRCEATGQAVADVAWNPTQGLHLLTASADDRNPVIKVWDLRSSTSMPLASLAGHHKGILSMAWCPHDEHLLLS
jgi:protein transport protein SEC31